MKKLSTVFIGTILICLIVSITLSSFLTISVGRQALDNESRYALENLAQRVSETLDNRLFHYQNQAEVLASVIAEEYKVNKVKEILTKYEKVLKELNQNNVEVTASYLVFNPIYVPYYDDINYPHQVLLVNDADGQAIKSDVLADQADLSSDEPYMAWFYGPIQERKGVWSDVYFDEFMNRRIITYSVPIISDSHAVGVIGIDISFLSFEELVSSIQVYETGYAILFNEKFDYLVHPFLTMEDNLSTINDGAYHYMREEFEASTTGIIEYFFYNEDKIMAFSYLSNGWIVSVAPPISEVFAAYDSLSRQLFFIISLGLMFSITIAFIVGNSISKPLTQFTNHIETMSTNDFVEKGFDTLDSSIYEIKSLNDHFYQLRLRLKTAFDEIKSHNTELESTVEQRTQDLRMMNEELEASIHSLQTAQEELVEIKKQEEVNILIKNITHRLNTPLGNAITTITFLESLLKKLDSKDPKVLDNIEYSFDIIHKSNNNIRYIIDGLNVLTNDIVSKSTSTIHLKTFIESRYIWALGKHEKDSIDLDLLVDENIYINCNQKTFENLIDRLINYSYRDFQLGSEEELRIIVDAKRKGQILTLLYNDNLAVHNAYEFYQSDFKMKDVSDANLELSIIDTIIVKGLKGRYKVINNNDFEQWVMKIPTD